MPNPYKKKAETDLLEYFPAKFACDLNGRTLSYEAVVLIPFVDEDVFLKAEEDMLASGELILTENEKIRNTTVFGYYIYSYNHDLDASA